MSKSLFLLKLREDYNADPSYSAPSYSVATGQYTSPSPHIATGMYNSAMFVIDTLNANGCEASIGVVNDANSIDAAVMGYNPTHVFIEGLWVTPEKMIELKNLPRHAGRIWVIRIHSEIPFLSSEGIAMSWIGQYTKAGIIVAPNAPRATEQIQWEADHTVPPSGENVLYLPNCYPIEYRTPPPVVQKAFIDIGCFGAFRPLKNQLQQAFAALKFAQSLGKTLRFHINGRIDAGGQGGINNIQGLFDQIDPSIGALVNHDWENRETFLDTLGQMDLLMQASISETFNIVGADAVLVGIPVLATDEIPWLYKMNVDSQSVPDILAKMQTVYNFRSFFITKNRLGLTRYSAESMTKWLQFLSAS